MFATALGPAVGGALTEAFDWRAIFVFQVPVAAAGAIAVLVGPAHAPAPPAPERPERFALRPALALALVSAALAAVLFLLVLLLVAGWNVSPLSAALAVTVIPLAALAGARLPGDPRTRAAAGCALVGGGVLALAWLPGASLWWTVIPQALAGVGMGLSLTALGGDLLPERTPRDAARLLAVRHAGIAAILAIAAPIAAHQLDVTTQTAKERGVALVLDAPLAPQDKIKLAPALLEGVDSDEPRAGLRRAVASERHELHRTRPRHLRRPRSARRRHARDRGRRGLPLVVPARRRRRPAGRGAAGRRHPARGHGCGRRVGLGTPVAYFALHRAIAPAPPAILDPCTAKRTLPKTGGMTGFLQEQALKLLDSAACKAGSSREELVLALADKDEAKRFEREHGVDPRYGGGGAAAAAEVGPSVKKRVSAPNTWGDRHARTAIVTRTAGSSAPAWRASSACSASSPASPSSRGAPSPSSPPAPTARPA